MQTINLATVTVDTTGVLLLSDDQVKALTAKGVMAAIINPSVDIVLVSVVGTNSDFPGAVAGSVANSPEVCPANTPTVVMHRTGNLKAISTSGNATVKLSLVTGP